MLGGVVALTVPSLLPHYRRSQVRHAAEDVAAFVHEARVAALHGGRCVRVRPGKDDGALVAEEGDRPDCRAATGWRRVERLLLPQAGVEARITSPIAFTPTGRVSTDRAAASRVLWVRHARIADHQLAVVVERGGPMCTLLFTTEGEEAPRKPEACP